MKPIKSLFTACCIILLISSVAMGAPDKTYKEYNLSITPTNASVTRGTTLVTLDQPPTAHSGTSTFFVKAGSGTTTISHWNRSGSNMTFHVDVTGVSVYTIGYGQSGASSWGGVAYDIGLKFSNYDNADAWSGASYYWIAQGIRLNSAVSAYAIEVAAANHEYSTFMRADLRESGGVSGFYTFPMRLLISE